MTTNNEIKINIPDGMEIDKENSTFECIKFKPIKKELPKTWEEFCNTYSLCSSKEYFIDNDSVLHVVSNTWHKRYADSDRNILPNKETAAAMLALCQLIQLRDCYNGEWKSDWTTNEIKYIIQCNNNTVIKNVKYGEQSVLAFKTCEIRDEFFENFRELIQIAKPLL